MLSIASMAAGQENYYLELGRSDYYLDGGEPPGQWFGDAAKRLGLEGRVTKTELRGLFQGKDPSGEHDLVQLGRGHQPGWDLTFSAPKSVSVAWALGSDEERQAIQAVHDQAVGEALSYVEDSAAFTRRGKGGTELEKASLVVATFQHGTSRAQDPQLHTHALVLNVAGREDGTFGTLRSRDLYLHKMAAGAVFRAELGRGLRQLGYELEQDKSAFRIVGVASELVDAFSKRRSAIRQALSEAGVSGSKAAEQMALSTREVKGHVARGELFGEWSKEAAELGNSKLEPSKARQASFNLKAQVGEAITRLEEKKSYFLERDVVRELATAVQAHGASAVELKALAQKALEGRRIHSLGGHGGYEHFTTRETFEREKRLLAGADKLSQRSRHQVSDRMLERVFKNRPTLTEEQRSALAHLTKDSGDLALVEGLAGTGKTYLLDAAREAWERSGYTVIGAAIAGKAALELESGAGIKSHTVYGLLKQLNPSLKERAEDAYWDIKLGSNRPPKPDWKVEFNSKTVLVIDEASMVGTNDFDELVTQARRAGAKLVFAGDYRQLPAIAAGAPFRALCERVGAAALREIIRQNELWEREALTELAEGNVRGALTQYALAERLHVAPRAEDARSALLSSWDKGRTSDIAKTLILVGTNEERVELNRAAQRLRLDGGELGAHSRLAHGGGELFEGDRVLFTRNQKTVGVANGDIGTVERIRLRPFRKAEVTVRLDRKQNGRPVYVTVQLDDSVELGYAVTTHKAQGATVERAFVLGSETMQSREFTYVQLSRAEERTDLFVSEALAGEDLAELTSRVSRSMERPMLHELEQTKELPLTQDLGL